MAVQLAAVAAKTKVISKMWNKKKYPSPNGKSGVKPGMSKALSQRWGQMRADGKNPMMMTVPIAKLTPKAIIFRKLRKMGQGIKTTIKRTAPRMPSRGK